MKTFKLILFCSILISYFSCENAKVIVDPQLLSVSNGTSFGFCIGNCVKEMTINATQAQYNIYNRDTKGSSPNLEITKTCSTNISSSDWKTLSQVIDFQSFKKLPEIIGCPDCADGGAEWIEIKYGDEIRKVTFEYQKDVPEISNLLSILRQSRQNFEKNCQ